VQPDLSGLVDEHDRLRSADRIIPMMIVVQLKGIYHAAALPGSMIVHQAGKVERGSLRSWGGRRSCRFAG